MTFESVSSCCFIVQTSSCPMSSASKRNKVEGGTPFPIGTSSGVSGSGRTTLDAALAKALTLSFINADDFHSEANKVKMSWGESLTDPDRAPSFVCTQGGSGHSIRKNPSC